jgi:hypothetical protein
MGALPAGRKEDGSDLKVLKIGQQALEIDFSSDVLNKAGLLSAKR